MDIETARGSAPQRWDVEYYADQRGISPITQFLDALDKKARAKCLKYISLLETEGTNLPSSIAKKVQDKIWELRPEWSGNEYRFFYAAMVGRKFVILHAVEKKSQRLRQRDILLAIARYNELTG